MKKLLAGVTCFMLLNYLGFGQSIYSFQGLGSLAHQGMPNNVGMGEVGIGTPTIWHINTMNPANLIYNSLSTFQVGVEVDKRSFSGNGISGSEADGGLRFLSYAFPIIPGKWTSSFGILPYSSVSYNTFSEGVVGGTTDINQVTDNRGEGGLTNFFWANGFAIKKKILVGVKASYTFGSIERGSTIAIGGVDVPVSTITYLDQESYSDLNLLFGLAYRYKYSEKTYFNFGLIYAPRSDFKGTSELTLIRLAGSGRELDTQEISISDINKEIPRTMGFGLSYQRINSLTIGFDIETQDWSSLETSPNPFNNYLKMALGLEWIPDHDNVNSYFKRAKYQMGLNRTQIPYIVNDQTLTDFGINFGASLPVSGFSTLDLAFKWGVLGNVDNGLIKENYYKIVLGATINDRWFIKRKYD